MQNTFASFVATLAIAAVYALAPADAADLGGGCCADLEERIAELEATTARKGNRKVSLTITGYVTKQIMFWDDGVEHNAYVQDIGPTQATNFRFTGEATIAPGWKAGYMIRIQDLRRKAETELGDKFDIKGFHDTVLGGGALPLTLLERRVDQWIASQKAKQA